MSDEAILAEFKRTQDQVEYLLEHYPATRNNDFYLQWLYMKYVLKLPMPYLDWQTMEDHSGKLETVRRTRQKIQNKYHKFPPTDPVVKARREREKRIRRIIHKV